MAYEKKVWSDRASEYPNRRKITNADDPADIKTVDVVRDEGLVTNEGIPYNAATMNDLEGRIEAGFGDVDGATPNWVTSVSGTYTTINGVSGYLQITLRRSYNVILIGAFANNFAIPNGSIDGFEFTYYHNKIFRPIGSLQFIGSAGDIQVEYGANSAAETVIMKISLAAPRQLNWRFSSSARNAFSGITAAYYDWKDIDNMTSWQNIETSIMQL